MIILTTLLLTLTATVGSNLNQPLLAEDDSLESGITHPEGPPVIQYATSKPRRPRFKSLIKWGALLYTTTAFLNDVVSIQKNDPLDSALFKPSDVIFKPSNSPYTFPLTTKDGEIVDSDGNPVHLQCVNWHSHLSQLPGGIQSQKISSLVDSIIQMGFNCVRLNYADETVVNNPHIVFGEHEELITQANPELKDKGAYDVLKVVVDELTKKGVMVFPNSHVIKHGWVGEGETREGAIYDLDLFAKALKKFLTDFKNNPLVAGVDIRNEPANTDDYRVLWGADQSALGLPPFVIRGLKASVMAFWAHILSLRGNYFSKITSTILLPPMVILMGADFNEMLQDTLLPIRQGDLSMASRFVYDSRPIFRWDLVAKKYGDMALAINPNLLVMVEANWHGISYWGAGHYPITLARDSQLVMSAHMYGYSGAMIPGLMTNWNTFNTFMWYNVLFAKTKLNRPIFIGETGCALDEEGQTYLYDNNCKMVFKWIRENKLGFAYWPFNAWKQEVVGNNTLWKPELFGLSDENYTGQRTITDTETGETMAISEMLKREGLLIPEPAN